MNSYALIILFTLLFEFILELISDYLNIKSLRSELPKEFENVYDAEKYKKSQEYTRATTKFGIITSVFGLITTLIFW